MKDFIKQINEARANAAKNMGTLASVYVDSIGTRPFKITIKRFETLEMCNVFYVERVGGKNHDFNAAWFYSKNFEDADIAKIAQRSVESV